MIEKWLVLQYSGVMKVFLWYFCWLSFQSLGKRDVKAWKVVGNGVLGRDVGLHHLGMFIKLKLMN